MRVTRTPKQRADSRHTGPSTRVDPSTPVSLPSNGAPDCPRFTLPLGATQAMCFKLLSQHFLTLSLLSILPHSTQKRRKVGFSPPVIHFPNPVTDGRCLHRGVNISPTRQQDGEASSAIVLVSDQLRSQYSRYTRLPFTNPLHAGATHQAKQVATPLLPLAKRFKS